MSRPQMTLVDYVIIAITPALIMVLIGSLVHFLLAVCYTGGFGGRINYVMSLFVFASVLIARIAIEEGRERSILFAIPLAIATLVVSGRFVQYQGSLAGFSFLINAGLIALIMWCADRLTWDCTVIDEREDVSGEGLLQTAGLDREEDERTEPATALEAAADSQPIGPDIEATSSRDAPPPRKTWWERFVEHRNRPHAPGVWVIYFSLAALPLFGIGQRFIPETDTDTRRYVFRLLCYYVGSALGLLMTSSFLGIRRYLRHRRLEMPMEMTGVWLATGTVMIFVLLFACALLPRPSAEYSVPDTLFGVTSPGDLHASRYGRGSEGAEDREDKATQAAQSEDDREQDSGGKDSGGEKSGGKDSGGKESGGKESGGKESGGKESGGKEAGGEEAGGKESGEQEAKKRQRPGGSSNDDPSEQPSQGESSSPEASGGSPPSSSFNPSQLFSGLFSGLSFLLKGLYYLFFIVLVGYLLWRYWDQVLRAVTDFLQAIRDFWANLFGGRQATSEAEEVEPVAVTPPRPFSDFADPFVTGDAARYSPQELLAYTFQALQAWGRERGCARDDEQTPHEYASYLQLQNTAVGREARRLADLYSFEAYSGRTLPSDQVQALRGLWQVLRSEQAAGGASVTQ